jgi:hypothetical protein
VVSRFKKEVVRRNEVRRIPEHYVYSVERKREKEDGK